MNEIKISDLLRYSFISLPLILSSEERAVPPTQDRSQGTRETSSLRASTRKMAYQLKTPPFLAPMGTYVGELQEKWLFPSDHLPIGMTIDDLNIASWNVLDADFMEWVTEKNSQGLSRSQIAQEHVYIDNTKLTVRDKHVADLILESLSHPTHPRHIMALQECNRPFLRELKSRLPEYYRLLSTGEETLLVDTREFEVVRHKAITPYPLTSPNRTAQETLLRRADGQLIRIVNVHIPGDPEKPGRFELTNYLAATFDPNITTLALGDMNFNELEMSDALNKAFATSNPFSLYSPYPTNISPFAFNSKAIDHFMFYSPTFKTVALNEPDQIMSELSPIVSLLQGSDYKVSQL